MGRRVVTLGAQRAPLDAQQAIGLMQSGDLKGSERLLRRMLKRNSQDINALHLLGLLEQQRGNSSEAVSWIRKAISLRPTEPTLYVNLGVVFESRTCYTEALACYTRALRLDPKHFVAQFNLGNVYAALGLHEQAMGAFSRALELEPSLVNAHSNLIFQQDHAWFTTPEQRLAERRRWNDTFAAPLAAEQVPLTNAPDPERSLKVGYVSADFRQHSAWLTFSSVMLEADRQHFEVYAYSSERQEDAATALLQAAGVVWRNVAGVSDADLAGLIREDGIDVLVDLSGYSAGNRLLTFARRPAPVQVTAWGYATGTGLDCMDAFLADPIAVPPALRDQFTERVCDLPCIIGYNPPADASDVATLPYERTGHVTFGSFNRPGKITTQTLELWARVLNAVPDARLLLKHTGLDSTFNEQRIRETLEDAGVETGRVSIFGWSPHREHMTAFGEVDIQLDTVPHGGGVTTLEAAWMGVPTLTMLGDRVSGRVSGSLMTTMGLPEFVAASADEYVAQAQRFAASPSLLAAIRSGLRERLAASPIADGPAYTRAVEAVYRSLWQHWCQRQQEQEAA